MNYLAHAYLSFDNPEILTGNMISDFIKGKAQYDYPKAIQKGIRLHRMIDNFTDFHPVTARAKEFFRPSYRLYSGAFCDVIYDHFLALDVELFSPYSGLENFTQKTYHILDNETTFFPTRFQQMFFYMKTQNWLLHYETKDGIRKSLSGVAHRAKYIDESQIAFEIFNQHYKELGDCYREFFPELIEFTKESLTELMEE